MDRSLTLIGTGHVFAIAQTVHDAILALEPDVVFVELDRGRLAALRARRRGDASPPGGGFVHRRLQRFQEAVAQMYGGEVGGEMLAAVDAGRQIGARVMLIDPPAENTLRRALREMTWRERFRGVGAMAKGAFQGLRRRSRTSVEEEIRRYQEDPQAVLDEVGRTFPTIRRIVIDERDALMAQRIRAGLPEGAKGVAVVGDGHVGGMEKLLADLEVQAYRLEAVRAGRLPKPVPLATGTTANVGFSFELRL